MSAPSARPIRSTPDDGSGQATYVASPKIKRRKPCARSGSAGRTASTVLASRLSSLGSPVTRALIFPQSFERDEEARPERLEPPAFGFEAQRSIQLSYRRARTGNRYNIDHVASSTECVAA